MELATVIPGNETGTKSALTEERAKLHKSMRRVDMMLFAAAAIIGLDTPAAVASYGAQAIIWLVFALVFFMIPYGMLAAELGTTFPVEGGPYVWTRMAFGRLAGAVTAVLYWISTPIWIGGTLTAASIAMINAFIVKTPLNTTEEIVFGLAFMWVTVLLAAVEMKWGKWGPNIGTIAKGAVAVLFVILVIVFLADKGRPAGTMTVTDLKPSLTGFLGVIGLLVFLFAGFETPSSAAEELVDAQRDVPKAIVGAGVISALIYGSVILGVLLIIPKAGLSKVSGFADAYNSVATVMGGATHDVGYIFGTLIILTLLLSGSAWFEASNRVQAITALNGGAPLWFGKFSKSGTPIVVNIVSGAIGSAFVLLIFLTANGSLSSFFAVMLSLVISSTALSYVFIFPALLMLRKKYPDRKRPYKVPGGQAGAWVVVVLTEIFVIVTGITLLWPGLVNNMFGQSYSMESNWGVSRVFFETVTLGAFIVMVLIGVIFWLLGRGAVAQGRVNDNDLLAIPESLTGPAHNAQRLTEPAAREATPPGPAL
ncbi:MAG: APC family permease [Acidimicrobiales bacterium]|jgi:amino acid transporter